MFDHPRPDPQLGVFETLLVADGRPVELDAHLDRLESSLEELFPNQDLPPLDVPGVKGPYRCITPGTSDWKGGDALGSMRITVTPASDDRLEARVSIREVARERPFSRRPVALRSLPLEGGLGAHKWADRSLLDAAQAALPEGALPLVVDADGATLEASRANVFVVRDGALFTPPLDGRILPGVTRAGVLEIAATVDLETQETELHRDDLLTADEVFVTGSVRGIERVGALDGTPLPAGGEIVERLAAELRRTWLADRSASARLG